MTKGRPQNIIVGYQGGEGAQDVARAALDLHSRFGARVEFLHAVDMPSPEDAGGRPDRMAEIEAEIEAGAWEHLAGELEGLASEAGTDYPVRDHLRVAVGHPAQILVSRAKEIQADLLVIGPHTRRGLLDFGSTARAVLGKSPCDVWVQPGTPREIKRILVPTDMSEDSLLAMHTACDLATGYGAKVTALHCFMPPDLAYAASPGYPIAGPTYVIDDVRKIASKEFDQVMADFDWKEVEHDQRFVEGRPQEAILELQDETDLIAMGSHGRTGLSAAVLGNVAYAVLKEARVPVLAIRHAKRTWLLS